MSAIFCKKISLHKIQDILYDQKHKKFIFKFQVPMQKKYCCRFSAMDFEMPVGDLEKAKALGRSLKKLRQKGELEFKNKDQEENNEKINLKKNMV